MHPEGDFASLYRIDVTILGNKFTKLCMAGICKQRSYTEASLSATLIYYVQTEPTGAQFDNAFLGPTSISIWYKLFHLTNLQILQ